MLNFLRPKWSAGAVFVCKKCSGNKDGDLRKALKAELKSVGLSKQVKVMGVGCLGLCPKGRVAVVLCPFGAPSSCHVVARDERAELFEKLKRMASAPGKLMRASEEAGASHAAE